MFEAIAYQTAAHPSFSVLLTARAGDMVHHALAVPAATTSVITTYEMNLVMVSEGVSLVRGLNLGDGRTTAGGAQGLGSPPRGLCRLSEGLVRGRMRGLTAASSGS